MYGQVACSSRGSGTWSGGRDRRAGANIRRARWRRVIVSVVLTGAAAFERGAIDQQVTFAGRAV
jgi:hypothetical protein